MEKLFSYGTLQQEQVQITTFGRKLEGIGDILIGYALGEVKITDQHVIQTSGADIHPILRYTGNINDEIPGTAFEVSAQELAMADDYEVEEYVRIEAKLKSGSAAWIYAARE